MINMKRSEMIIFETRGYSTPTDIEALILNMHNRRMPIVVSKVDVLNAAAMKSHKDVIELLKKDGLDILPLVKINNKITNPQKARQILLNMMN